MKEDEKYLNIRVMTWEEVFEVDKYISVIIYMQYPRLWLL